MLATETHNAQTPHFFSYSKPRNILLVEDDRSMRMFVEQQLRGYGYEVTGCPDGETAWDVLERSPDRADIILLDKTLPGIDGLEVLHRIKSDPALRRMPVVMLTGSDDRNSMKESLDSGVFYYLAKPADIDVLQSVVSSAMRRVESTRNLLRQTDLYRTGMKNAQSTKFMFKTPQEAEAIAAILSGCFPDPERAVIGLYELMINAVEHGNLEIGYELKGRLVGGNLLNDEISRRLLDPQYKNRVAEVVTTSKDDGIYVIVTDAGPGFKATQFLSLDPGRAGTKNGRGIAQARAISFDKLGYSKKGNQAVAFVSGTERIEW